MHNIDSFHMRGAENDNVRIVDYGFIIKTVSIVFAKSDTLCSLDPYGIWGTNIVGVSFWIFFVYGLYIIET